MLLALVLSSVLAQDTGFVPDIGQRRADTRGFFGASLVGAASYGAGFGLGVGLQLEGGATFNDQLSLGLRAFASTLLLSVDTGAAVGLDLLLNEYFSVGIGVGARLYVFAISPAAVSVGVPLRVRFHPIVRGDAQLHRSSLVVGLEATPGVAVASWGGESGGRPVPAAAVSGMLTIGYLWW